MGAGVRGKRNAPRKTTRIFHTYTCRGPGFRIGKIKEELSVIEKKNKTENSTKKIFTSIL